ncbi:MAG: formate/nitrite transporter family protein [Tannerellaceae bacterium]|nr:formate/nitrite transporter family protein [Tannerellaceae bacterium]
MSLNRPNEATQAFAAAGIYKSSLPLQKLALLSILGGAFIAFGGLLSVYVSGGMPEVLATNPGLVKLTAGLLFPVGLFMVSLTGADLFTSDCTAFTLPLLQKELPVKRFAFLLLFSYLFNFIGAQIVAGPLAAGSGLFSSHPFQDYLHYYAGAKVYQDFWTVLVKGIGANWLVCLAMWMGYIAKDVIGKWVGISIPVALFVTLGYEHSIANMFFIPAAIYSGATVTWPEFLVNNLLPATIGNLIGGACLVGGVYWYLHLKK